MANEKILLIEDDSDLKIIISEFLKKDSFEVMTASNGDDGIDYAKSFCPSLILLDLMLPEIDGFEVCRNIRTFSYVPIIIISAKSTDMDKMLSLGIGADDYLTKPFSMFELEARIKSHIRRFNEFSKKQNETVNQIKVYGEIEINSKAYTVSVSGKTVDMTTREFKLLEFLASHPRIVFTKQQLLDEVWGDSEYIDENTITVYIGRIREKLTKAGACYIKTVWGAGYKWEM